MVSRFQGFKGFEVVRFQGFEVVSDEEVARGKCNVVQGVGGLPWVPKGGRHEG